MNAVLFSSNKTEWETPQWLFDKISAAIGGFDIDVCALPENAKCTNYYTPEQDGLRQVWSGKCWMNPPYGKEVKMWVSKAFKNSGRNQVVALLPARTDTKWFHENITLQRCYKNLDIFLVDIKKGISGCLTCFLPGRLKFKGAKHSAPFPSMIVCWR